MKKLLFIILMISIVMLCFAACSKAEPADITNYFETTTKANTMSDITFGKKEYKGFILNNIYHSDEGEIHFNLYIPESYDGKEPYALFVTLPGWEGLYFQGVGENLYNEDFAFEAQKYNDKMIIVAPQLDDWGKTSATQAIALTEYFINNYNIDKSKVFVNGYSGGGETLSIMLGMKPELFTKALHVSSKWDGDLETLEKAKMPLYIFIGESDEYYGSDYAIEAYNELYNIYESQGLSKDEIDALLILDVKDKAYFKENNMSNQHAGGNLAAFDKTVMNWLFNKEKKTEIKIEQEGYTTAVPSEYKKKATQQGKVTRLDYKSKDYAGSNKYITKTAYVYTPYGYDESDTKTRYDIIYLMHGWGGHAGEYFDYSKNVFDNMIANGDIPPVIIVSPSFYNDNSSTDFGASVSTLRAFHSDFENDLMPAVESKYHTYALSTFDEDLKASRDHRVFGGFSLGSVTTWQIFCYDFDYVRYFLPMSGSSWYFGGYGDFQTEKNVDFIEQLVKDNNLDERGYFIYHAVGTNDVVKEQTLMQAEEMLDRKDVFTPEHYVFYQKQGGYHDMNAVQEYIYNALPLFLSGNI